MNSLVSKKTALYRHYDKDGALLYVGISLSAVARLKQHQGSASWFYDIDYIEISWFKSRALAMMVEAVVVAVEEPKYNILLKHGFSKRYYIKNKETGEEMTLRKFSKIYNRSLER